MRTLVLLLCAAGLVLGEVPGFHSPVQIQADGALLDVGVISDPFMTDWDGDGLHDLLVGQFYPGKVRLYRNVGTNAVPVFQFQGYLQADGSDIEVSAG